MTLLKKFAAKCFGFAAMVSIAAVAQDSGFSFNNKNALPEIGVVASEAIPIDKEIQIGDAVMMQVRGQMPLVNDPVLNEYLQDLGNRLVAHADNVKFPYLFFWVNDDAINAFAFPGGRIGVHTGLIKRAKNESELASVLAHEIAHVTQRHSARRILAQQKAQPLAIASLVGGLLLGVAASNAEAGIAALQASQAAQIQYGLDYTRSNEQEADRIGIGMLSRAGFDPRGASTFFSTLAEQYRLVSRPPARLLSHPLTETRIADARNRLSSYPERNLPPSLDFQLSRVRVMARYSYDEDYAVEYFTEAAKQRNTAVPQAAKYGLVIALMRVGEFDQAAPILNQLLLNDPDNLFYLDAATDISIEQGQFQQAIDRLQSPLKLKPRNSVIVLNLANAYIKNKQYQDAIDLLRNFLIVNPEYHLAYDLLAQAHREKKNFKDMHETKAEMYTLYGAFSRAVDELQFAYNFADDNHLAKQRIRARIKQIRDQEERLKRL